MKPISILTGLKNLLALVKKDNPEADIKQTQVTLGNPVDNEESGLSSVKITAVTDRGYFGEVTVDYTRRLLSDYLKDGEFLLVDSTQTPEDVLGSLGELFNIVPDDIDVNDFVVPGDETDTIKIITLSSIPGFVYKEGEQIDVVISTSEPVEGEAWRGMDTDQYRVTSNGVGRRLPERLSNLGIVYGGLVDNTASNVVRKITSELTQLSPTLTLGNARTQFAGGGVDKDAVFYGGQASTGGLPTKNIVTVFNNDGSLRQGETTLGGGWGRGAGIGFEELALFHGGLDTANTPLRLVRRIDVDGVQVDNDSSLGTANVDHAATRINQVGVVWGGDIHRNTLRIDSTGTQIGTENTLGTGRNNVSAGTANTTAMFYGGDNNNSMLTRINLEGTLVGNERTLGGGLTKGAGMSINRKAVFYGMYDGVCKTISISEDTTLTVSEQTLSESTLSNPAGASIRL